MIEGLRPLRRWSSAGRLEGVAALGCATFVVMALASEVVASLHANSPIPSWALRLFPLGWPQPLRVVWWTSVGAAALGYRALLGRLGMPQPRWVIVVSVAPFIIFAAGIAVGADWATWH